MSDSFFGYDDWKSTEPDPDIDPGPVPPSRITPVPSYRAKQPTRPCVPMTITIPAWDPTTEITEKFADRARAIFEQRLLEFMASHREACRALLDATPDKP